MNIMNEKQIKLAKEETEILTLTAMFGIFPNEENKAKLEEALTKYIKGIVKSFSTFSLAKGVTSTVLSCTDFALGISSFVQNNPISGGAFTGAGVGFLAVAADAFRTFRKLKKLDAITPENAREMYNQFENNYNAHVNTVLKYVDILADVHEKPTDEEICNASIVIVEVDDSEAAETEVVTPETSETPITLQ